MQEKQLFDCKHGKVALSILSGYQLKKSKNGAGQE